MMSLPVVVVVSAMVCIGALSSQIFSDGDESAMHYLNVASQSEPPPFPCLLQNGCVCNHSVISQNVFDQQYYGTCENCAKGWAGPFCQMIDVPCMNGGALLNASNTSSLCACLPQWTGPSCGEMQCANTKGGRGEHHVASPNTSTHACDACLDGWSGITCSKCEANSACESLSGLPGGSICDTSLLVRGNAKHLECTVANPAFLKLLGKHVDGRVTMDCRSATPSTPFASMEARAEGTCDVAFYRMEENLSFVDPFFFCSAQNCSVVVDAEKGTDTAKNQPTSWFVLVLSVGQVWLLGGCVALATVGQFSKLLGKRHMSVIVLWVTVALVVGLGAYVLILTIIMNSANTSSRNVATYQCAATKCECAPDPPPQYSPVCRTSAFGTHVLPIILHGMSLKCFTDDNTCVFTPNDVPISVALKCEATECVDPVIFPEGPSISGPRPSESQKQQGIDLVVFGIACAFVAVGGLLLHLHSTITKTRDATHEFTTMFLSEESSTLPVENARRSVSMLSDASELRTVGDDDEDDQGREDAVVDEGSSIVGAPGDDENVASPQAYHPITTVDSDEDIHDDDESHGLLQAREAHVVNRAAQRKGHNLTRGKMKSVRDLWKVNATPVILDLRSVSYHLLPHCTLLQRGQRHRQPQEVKYILKDVTFSVQSGEVLALMGPSGAGKTTLLDLLSARAKDGARSGIMSINGVPINNEDRVCQYRSMVGYVSQEDTLLPSLTVHETITYAARLKLPTSFDTKTIASIVDAVIASLKLTRCKDTLIGDGSGLRGVSGGEKRRVSIAVELVANPRILFLDEPTSGLDACSAVSVMETIALVARDSPMRQYAPHFFSFQPIVIFSIHQPSVEIFQLFDKVLLLSRGYAVYYGAANETVSFLQARVQVEREAAILASEGGGHYFVQNPAEVVMKLEDRMTDEDRESLREERNAIGATSHDGHALPIDPKVGESILQLAVAARKYYPNGWKQLFLLTSRAISALLGSFHLIVCHSIVTFVVGSLMCVLYHQEGLDLPGALNRAGSITFLLLVVAFVSLSALEQLISERKLFIVERENGYYRTLPYLISKVLVDVIPLRVIPIGLLGAVIYFPMGLRTDNGFYFLWFLGILTLFSVCMTLLTLAIGVIMGSFGAAALVSSVVILWNFVFGGLLVQADTIPPLLAVFRSLSPFFLSFESLLINELNGQLCTFAPTDATGRPAATAIPLFCVQYLENLGLHPTRFAADVLMLGGITAILFAFVWVLLAYFVRVSR